MATSINLLPRANQNLLSGTLQSYLSDSADYMVGDNVPLSTRLPTYFLIEPDNATKRELVKVYDVSGNNIYIVRGLNNGGVGIAHNQGTTYEERITIEHLNSWVDALENGWIFDHTDVYTFSQVSSTSFKITGVDRTNIYTAGTVVRFNGSDTATVSSSSYSSGDTTVEVDSSVVPATITSVEVYYNKVFAKEHNADGTHKSGITLTSPVINTSFSGTAKATGSEINTGTENAKIVTPKAIADSNVVFTDKTQTLTNKTLTKRVTSITSSSTPTPNSDTTDIYIITALEEAATFGAPTGSPTNGQGLIIRIKDDGTQRALDFNSIYRFGDILKPTTTIANKTLYIGFIYNSTDSKWDCVAYINNL